MWSLALDSFGNGEVEEKLSIATDKLLSNFPIDKPKIENSYGYPKWLTVITAVKDRITKLDFDRIWEFISKYVLEDEGDPVLIPDLKDWDEVKELLMKKRLTKSALEKRSYSPRT